MKNFEKYLRETRIIIENRITYYISWVSKFYSFINKNPYDSVLPAEIDRFLKNTGKYSEDRQIKQAEDAIRLFLYFLSKKRDKQKGRGNVAAERKTVAELMKRALRLRHRSVSTERTYILWLRSFYKYLGGITPYELSIKLRSYIKCKDTAPRCYPVLNILLLFS